MTYELLKQRIDDLSRIIDAPATALPDLGKSSDMGHPHIEMDADGFHYIVSERGRESSRAATQDLDELLYWTFRDISFSMACMHEAANRNYAQDFRRILFGHQLQLLSALSPAWRMRCEKELEEILSKHPYLDKK